MKPCTISNEALKFGAQTRITITKPVANKKVDFLKEGSRSWNTLLDPLHGAPYRGYGCSAEVRGERR